MIIKYKCSQKDREETEPERKTKSQGEKKMQSHREECRRKQ